MRKALFVLALAVVLTVALASAAFAEHAPSNYSTWSAAGPNAGTNASPHEDYRTTTVKCNVCHSVHRSAVAGQAIRNQVNGAWITATASDPEMLLRSTVAESCKYCHIDTAAGGVRLWNGNSANWGEYAAFSSGYGHNHTSCTECHSVHGAYTFKGAAATKLLKINVENMLRPQFFTNTDLDPLTGKRAGINPVGANVANHEYDDPWTGEAVETAIQDEIFTAPDGLAPAVSLVATGNEQQFATLADVIEGDAAATMNSAVGANMKDLQVGAFCTECHPTYASDSYAIVNEDQDVGLFGGTYGGWTLSTTADPDGIGGTWKMKGHPVVDTWDKRTGSVRNATTGFNAHGSTIATDTTISWADADTCRKCHDAGTTDAAAGIVYSSFPHVTPGYYRFMSAASSNASYTADVLGATYPPTNAGNLPWLTTGSAVATFTNLSIPGYGATAYNEAAGANAYPGQNYKSNNAQNPQNSDHIGTDGLCLKCHRNNNVAGSALGVGRTF